MSFRSVRVVLSAIQALAILLVCSAVHGQLILNEANNVGENSLIQPDVAKPYEGFDFGVLPFSFKNNPPNAPTNPGNPFPSDLDAVTPGNQTTLPNGWNLSQPTGWARILGNGGDWLELVVTDDHTDLRGYTLYWENDDGPVNGITGQNPEERGFIKLLNHPAFADLRAGTIITLSEDAFVAEWRDKYPFAPPYDEGGPAPHDTGHLYDLRTDLSFNPFGDDDWHVHFHVDESLTDNGFDTEYFKGYSDIKVDNDDWTLWVFDSTNTTVVEQAEDPTVTSVSGLDVGLVQGPIGEGIPGWGQNTGGGGINNQELMNLVADPVSGLTGADYEDADFSTFGRPNLFNANTENILDGVQNFSALRDPVLEFTHLWSAAGTADFSDPGNWRKAANPMVPASGPQDPWTAVLHNATGGNRAAHLAGNAAIRFGTISAESGTMTLRIQSGATLTVDGSPRPGRLLVKSGGILQNQGDVNAHTVEAFHGGIVSGSGMFHANVVNSAGTIAPGDGVGQLTIQGDFQQYAEGTLAIEIGGLVSGQYDRLVIEGSARLDGTLNIKLANGFQPVISTNYTIATAASLVDLGLTLTGATAGFSLDVVAGNQLVLRFTGSGISGDFNSDGLYDCTDVNALVADIVGPGTPATYDMNNDGIVNQTDLQSWLSVAGSVNLPSGGSYLMGDANLDGVVDGSDFGAWNSNKFNSVPAWCSGDFNADGAVDGSDFGVWNSNKFTAADGAQAVPEPSGVMLLGICLMAGLRRRRGSTARSTSAAWRSCRFVEGEFPIDRCAANEPGQPTGARLS